MEMHVINSGSSGNGYVIRTADDYLLIECGVKPKEMLKAINFQTSKVSGCIATHCHADHIQYIKDYAMYGFHIYMSKESKLAVSGVTDIPRMKKQNIGKYGVVPFKVPHNETECDGFLISHPEFGNLLFITDAEMCPYDMSGANISHLMIECNYSVEYISHEEENKDHVFNGHMELQTCKRFIRTIYGENLKSVGLIHLSRTNGDPEKFKREIETEFPGIYVWVAAKGLTVEL